LFDLYLNTSPFPQNNPSLLEETLCFGIGWIGSKLNVAVFPIDITNKGCLEAHSIFDGTKIEPNHAGLFGNVAVNNPKNVKLTSWSKLRLSSSPTARTTRLAPADTKFAIYPVASTSFPRSLNGDPLYHSTMDDGEGLRRRIANRWEGSKDGVPYLGHWFVTSNRSAPCLERILVPSSIQG